MASIIKGTVALKKKKAHFIAEANFSSCDHMLTGKFINEYHNLHISFISDTFETAWEITSCLELF